MQLGPSSVTPPPQLACLFLAMFRPKIKLFILKTVFKRAINICSLQFSTPTLNISDNLKTALRKVKYWFNKAWKYFIWVFYFWHFAPLFLLVAPDFHKVNFTGRNAATRRLETGDCSVWTLWTLLPIWKLRGELNPAWVCSPLTVATSSHHLRQRDE